MKKCIFLDIDGVLNSSRSVVAKIGLDENSSEVKELQNTVGSIPYGAIHALRTVDPVCVALVNSFIKDVGSNCRLILSSTHRKHFHNGRYGSVEHLIALREYLTVMGLFVPLDFDITPVLHQMRGSEVRKWIEDNIDYDLQYVIIDDGTDFNPDQPLVLVDASTGFDLPHLNDARKYLGFSEQSLILM